MIAAVTGLALLAVPVLLFVAGGAWMMRATGRARFRSRRSLPHSRPLNLRIRGYDAAGAQAYWSWLGPDGRLAEARFLRADMLFPFWYGGLFAASMSLAWILLDRPVPPALWAIPVGTAMLADWVENAVHLRELASFSEARTPADGAVRLASWATSIKLVSFWLATLLMAALAAAVAAGLR